MKNKIAKIAKGIMWFLDVVLFLGTSFVLGFMMSMYSVYIGNNPIYSIFLLFLIFLIVIFIIYAICKFLTKD